MQSRKSLPSVAHSMTHAGRSVKNPGISAIQARRSTSRLDSRTTLHEQLNEETHMQRRWVTVALIAAIGAGALGAQTQAAKPADGEQFVGDWTGTWEGGGTGKFDIKFERGADGAITGGVSVGTDMGDYTAKFSTVKFEGGKLTARYDYTPDPQGEISVTGNFEAKQATGTWSLGAKGQAGQGMAEGTWTVTKK
jgi:hypothetical protein